MIAEVWFTVVTLAVIAGTVVFFAIGKIRTDLVALCALLCLMLSGVLTPQEALAGFSNSVILTIAGMFVVGGAIVRSGLANVISGKILQVAGSNTNVLYMLTMLISALIGSLVSNTGTVAIMMPIVVSMARTIKASPSRFLMPLAFMSSMGGMLTLIGNPPNMVVNDLYVKAGYESLSLFSFFPIGMVCLSFGMLILAPVTYWYLSRRKTNDGAAFDETPSLRDLADKYQLARHMYKMTVPKGSQMVGQSLAELGLTRAFGVVIQEIRRTRHRAFSSSHKEQLVPGPETVIKPGDVLYGMGAAESLEKLAAAYGLVFAAGKEAQDDDDKYLFESIGICELVLMSSSRLVGLTVESAGIREQFGLTILGIQRGDQYILDNFTAQTMQAGDALLVQGAWGNITKLDESSRHWVVVGRPQDYVQTGKKGAMSFVAVVIALMIAAMALNLLPTVTAVLLAAVVLVVGRCFRNMEDVYASVNWETIVMIACLLPMATAMGKTGLIDVASARMNVIGEHYGPYVALAVVYGVTSAMNIIISFTPVTLLVAPVALRLALDLGVSPLPFMFAVATAASMCFASSFSTPSNALVVSVGRYTFMDYLKIGLPLQALLGVIMVMVLPLLFPF